MKPTKVAAIGFDLDYTLWDQDAFMSSFIQATAQDLADRFALERGRVIGVFVGALVRLTMHHPRLFGMALADLGVGDPDVERELVERYRRHRPPLHPYPGTQKVLGWLRDAGFRLFLVTDGNPSTQRYKVAALGLEPWFDAMVFTDELSGNHPKPSPVPFALAASRLGVAPEECVYVGDDPSRDFQGARQLGIRTIGVATGPFAGLAVAPDMLPDQRIDRLEHLRGVL
jgi:putative hydrolase of the HAD superfamily